MIRAIVAGVTLLVACSPYEGPPPAVPFSEMSAGVANGTTLTVRIVVNGTLIRTFAPGEAGTIPSSALPKLSWRVEARSVTGRVLTSMTVNGGSVTRTATPEGGSEHRGVAARVDLSCGRLDIWSGPPPLGPLPGPGTPGDCVP